MAFGSLLYQSAPRGMPDNNTHWSIFPATWYPHTPRTDEEARELERRVGHHRGVAEHFLLSDVRRRYADRPRRELDAAIREMREEATRAGHWDVCKHDVLEVAAQRLAATERLPAPPPPPPPTESTISPAFIAWHLAEAAAYAAQAAATGVSLPTTTPVDSHLGDGDDEDDDDSCRHADSSDSDPTGFVGGDSDADEASDGEGLWSF